MAGWAWGSRPGGAGRGWRGGLHGSPERGGGAGIKVLSPHPPQLCLRAHSGAPGPAPGVESAAWATLPHPLGLEAAGLLQAGSTPGSAPPPSGCGVTGCPSAATRTPGTSLGWPGPARSVCGEAGQGLRAGGAGPPGAWLTLLARGPRVAVHAVALPGDGVTVGTPRAATAQGTAGPEEAPRAACGGGSRRKRPGCGPHLPSQGPRPPVAPVWSHAGTNSSSLSFPGPVNSRRSGCQDRGPARRGTWWPGQPTDTARPRPHMPAAQGGLLPARRGPLPLTVASIPGTLWVVWGQRVALTTQAGAPCWDPLSGRSTAEGGTGREGAQPRALGSGGSASPSRLPTAGRQTHRAHKWPPCVPGGKGSGQ